MTVPKLLSRMKVEVTWSLNSVTNWKALITSVIAAQLKLHGVSVQRVPDNDNVDNNLNANTDVCHILQIWFGMTFVSREDY